MTVIAGWPRSPMQKDDSHAAFPGLAQLAGRKMLTVWRDGPAHTGGTNGRIMASYFESDLSMIVRPWLVADGPYDLRDPSITVSRDGSKVWMTYFDYPPTDGGQPVCRSWLVTSTDEGKSFGNGIQIGAGFYHLAVCAAPIERDDGSLLVLTYGKRYPSQQFDSVYAFYIAASGVQSFAVAANGTADGRHYQEPTAIQLSNGAILAAFRYGNKSQIAVSASWNEGATWSAPTPKFAGWGRPTLFELSTGPTVCIFRDLAPTYPYAAVYRVSPDRGASWNEQKQIGPVPGSQTTYASLVETAPGLLTGVIGAEENNNTSTIRAFFMLDT